MQAEAEKSANAQIGELREQLNEKVSECIAPMLATTLVALLTALYVHSCVKHKLQTRSLAYALRAG